MPTPGSLFREKRRKLGWGLQDVADELLLSVSQVEAIEQDDFDSLPETPYIIGYWRSYGNLLGIDITGEIDSYRESRDTPLSDIVLKPNHRSTHHLQEKLRKRSAVVFLVLSVLFLGVIWYWQTPENILITQWSDIDTDPQLVIIDSTDSAEPGTAEDGRSPDTQNLSAIVLPEPNFSEGFSADDEQESDHSERYLPEDPVPQGEQQSPGASEQVPENTVENTDPGSTGQEAIPPDSDSSGQSTGPDLLSSSRDESPAPAVEAGPGTSDAEEAEVTTEAVAVLPEVVQEPVAPAGTAGETAGTGEAAAVLPEAVQEPVAPAGTAEAEVRLESSIGTVIDPTSKNQVVVQVEKSMWLDVRERDGTKLFFGNVGPDIPLIINGKAPFWVYLGEADSASVIYLGQPVRFEANEGEPFVQIVVGELPDQNPVGPVGPTEPTEPVDPVTESNE
ncbi:MAG: DUF4115 domain-containing protein [Gammaproteobacteria bacterium]|nr:DUF4115 domain-containing protein [Gammaproteobacteria bacterium]